jgi:hypothetical protein
MIIQHCHRYYLGLLSKDMTMVEHFILYIDYINEDGTRTIDVPLLKQTFYTLDAHEAFVKAMEAITDYYDHHDNSRTFIMPSWQGEIRETIENIKVENGQVLYEVRKKLEESQKPMPRDIAEVVNKNFWDLIGDDDHDDK